VAHVYIDPHTQAPFTLAGEARATFTSTGPATAATFRTTLSATGVRLSKVSADRVVLDAVVTYDRTTITKGTITAGAAAAALTGHVDYDDPMPFEARLATEGIPLGTLLATVGAPAPPPAFAPAVVSGDIQATGAAQEPVRGRADDTTWRVGGEVRLRVAEPAAAGAGVATTAARTLLPVTVTGPVSVDPAAVRLRGLAIRGAARGGGAVLPDVTVAGQVGIDEPYPLALEGEARVADLGALDPFLGAAATTYPLRGAARARGRVTGPLASPAFVGDLEATGFAVGRYGPADVSGPVALSSARLASSGLAVRLGTTRARAAGRLDLPGPATGVAAPSVVLDVAAEPVVVEEALAAAGVDLPLAGRGRLAARLTGPIGALEGEASVSLGAVRAFDQPVDRLEAALGFGARGAVRVSRLLATRGDARLTGRAERSEAGALSGEMALERLPVQQIREVARRQLPIAGVLSAQATFGGTWAAPRVTGRVGLTGAVYEGVPLGDSGLDASLDWPALAVRGTLVQRDIGVVANVKLDGARPYVVALDLNNPNLAPYLARLSPGRAVRASARGFVRAAGTLDDLQASRAELSLDALRVDLGDFYLQNIGRVAVLYERERLTIESATLQGPTSQAVFGGHVDLGARTLDLRVNGGLDLSIARLFTDRLARARGQATIVAQAVGPIDQPRLYGAAQLSGGSLAVRGLEPPLPVEELAGVVAFDANRVAFDGVTARVGGGRARLTGAIELAAFRPSIYNLTVNYEDVQLAIPAYLPSTSRGTLRLVGRQNDLLLSGNVDVVRAVYNRRIDVDVEALYRAIRQALEPRRSVQTDPTASGIRVDIRIVADDNVRVETGLFDAELRANLQLVGRVADPNLLGSVEVVRGEIRFRDTVFEVTSGRADFIDPFRINPSFDLTAVAEIRDYEVRLRLSGTVEKYRVELSSPSHPSLTELDILSLITVGVVASEARDRITGATGAGQVGGTGGGGVTTAQALAVLAGANRQIEREVQRYTGIDTFQIEPGVARSTGQAEPRLTVGKQVGDLVVRYSRGVGSEQEQTVLLEYRLSTNLALVAQWNEVESFGGGVKFRFQFR
jgi:hypothetical protein